MHIDVCARKTLIEDVTRERERGREEIIRFVRTHLALHRRNGSNGGEKKEEEGAKHHQ